MADPLRNVRPEEIRALFESATGGFEVPGRTAGASSSGDSTPEEARARAIVALVQKKAEEARRTMWPLYKKAALNKEYEADNQFAAWNPERKSIVRNPGNRNVGHAAQHLQRTQLNLFKPTLNAIKAHFLASRAQIVVRPGSTEEDVVESSRLLQRVLGTHEWQRQGMQEIQAQLVNQMLSQGTGILKVVWNPKGGKYLGLQPKPRIVDGEPIQEHEFDPISGAFKPREQDGQPMWVPEVGADGQPVMEHRWEGCIETCVVSIRDLLVDPTARKFSEARWVIHRYETTPSWVYDRWGVRVSASSNVDGEPDKQFGQGGFFGYNRRYDNDEMPGANVEVLECYLCPGTYSFGPNQGQELTFEKGFLATVAGDTLIEDATGANPNDHGEFPFAFMPALRVTDELWGDTIANSLRILQNSLNKTASQITLANDLMGNPQWLLPNGCKMPDQDRINRAGVHKRYEPGMNGEKPEIVPGAQVSPSVWRYFDSMRQMFQEISGVRDGGLAGGAPGSIESGKALDILKQSDLSKLATMGQEIGQGLERWAWLNMKLIQQHWKTRRLITVVGDQRVSEAFSFSGRDVTDSMQPAVVPESTIPQTQQMKELKADKMLQLGLIKPYDYLRRLGEDSAEEFTAQTMDISNARTENAYAKRFGIIPTPSNQMEIEDHELHMPEHRRALLDPALRNQPAKWMALFKHYKEHEALAGEAQQTALRGAAEAQQAFQPMKGPELPPTPAAGGQAPALG